MNLKLESRLLGEISITSDMQIIPPLWQKEEELKSFLRKVKEESEKDGWKLNIQKTKIIASDLILENRWGNNGNKWQCLFSWALKSLQLVTAAMELKDACSLEEKLWQT